MIDYIQGDLIEAFAAGEVEAIGHQANCQCVMKSGFAKALTKAYPEAAEADSNTIKGDWNKLGSSSMVVTPIATGYGWIFNLYGQFSYGREKGVVYTDLDALESALEGMKLFVDAAGIGKLGFPKLGCGLGGADWEDVEDILIRVFGDEYIINVYVLD